MTTDPGAVPGPDPVRTRPRWWWTLHTGNWLVRAAGSVLVAVLTVVRTSGADHRVFEVAVLVILGVLMVLWRVVDGRRRQPRRRSTGLLVVTLCGLAVLGGIGSVVSPGRSVLAFAMMAALAAGDGLDLGPACLVTVAGVTGVGIGGVVFGVSNANAIGLPLLLVVCALAGRARREAHLRADQAALMVAHMGQAQGEQRRAAALDERNRIAREIHDVLAHSLSALEIQIEAARAVLAESGDVAIASRLLDHAHHLANDGLDEARRAVHALRTDTPPLPESLATMVDRHRERHGQPVCLDVTGPVRLLPLDANLALLRTAREALTNSARHAPDTAVAVRLDYSLEATTLTVTNPVTVPAPTASGGRGPGAGGPGGGYGLVGMRERLLLIDGTLSVGSADGRWTVEASVPL